MTRRQRHNNILAWFDRSRVKWELDGMLAGKGLSILSDEATEELARRCIASHKFTEKLNARNRATRLAQVGSAA